MGCTSPPVPLRRRLVGSPFWALVHLMMGTYVRCGRILRASFVAFRCVSLRFGVFLYVYVSFHVRIMLFFRAFVCLFRVATAVFNPQTVSSHVVLSLLFSAHSDGLSFFFVLALSLLWWSAAVVWVLWALIECLVFCFCCGAALFLGHHSDGLSNACLCFFFCSRPPVTKPGNYLGRVCQHSPSALQPPVVRQSNYLSPVCTHWAGCVCVVHS